MSKDVFRLAAFSALLLAGSCAAPGPDNNAVTTVDPDRLHPITVQPDYRVAKVSYLGGGSLAPEDSAKWAADFDSFASPKSSTFAYPSARIMMFSGLMSR